MNELDSFLQQFQKRDLNLKNWLSDKASQLKKGDVSVYLGVAHNHLSYKTYVIIRLDDECFYSYCTDRDTDEAFKLRDKFLNIFKNTNNIV